jgi:hypothetical protein
LNRLVGLVLLLQAAGTENSCVIEKWMTCNWKVDDYVNQCLCDVFKCRYDRLWRIKNGKTRFYIKREQKFSRYEDNKWRAPVYLL